MSEMALKSLKNQKYINDDMLQESLIYIWLLLPKLSIIKLQYAFSYLYKSIKHNIINMILKNEKHGNMIELDHNFIDKGNYYYNNDCYYNTDKYLTDNSYSADQAFTDEQIKTDIINALDKKIINEKVISKSSTVFLILLKQYLFDHQYDERGFKQYVMNKMCIDLFPYLSPPVCTIDLANVPESYPHS